MTGSLLPSTIWVLAAGVLVTAAAGLDGRQTAGGRAAETYLSASIDAEGQLAVVSDRRAVVIPRAPRQSEFKDPVVSSDGIAVGAQALYPNCCTSDDLPLELVVLSQGVVHRFKGNGLPILDWQFAAGGTRVAYGQQPAHFGCVVRYELRDTASGRLIEAVDVPQPCWENVPLKTVRIPDWVTALTQRPR